MPKVLTQIDEPYASLGLESEILEILQEAFLYKVSRVAVATHQGSLGQIEDRPDRIDPTFAGEVDQVPSQRTDTEIVERTVIVLPIGCTGVVDRAERRTDVARVREEFRRIG